MRSYVSLFLHRFHAGRGGRVLSSAVHTPPFPETAGAGMAENRSKEACLDDGISSHIILKTPADFNTQLVESPVDFSQRKEYNKSGKAGRTLSAGCDLDGSRLFQFGARTRGGSRNV